MKKFFAAVLLLLVSIPNAALAKFSSRRPKWYELDSWDYSDFYLGILILVLIIGIIHAITPDSKPKDQ